jgi:hypothetical protein
MRLSMPAVHEAGHAVVAAYLRVPFTHVTIKPGNRYGGVAYGGYVRTGTPVNLRRYLESKRTGIWRARSDEEITREVKRQITNQVLVSLAGRAAAEMPEVNWGREIPEECYEGDEENVKAFAEVTVGTLGDEGFRVNIAGDDFEAWRFALLQRAREIVAIPYVREAILNVAYNLRCEYELAKKGISSKEVRWELQWSKDHFVSPDAKRQGRLSGLSGSPVTSCVLVEG